MPKVELELGTQESARPQTQASDRAASEIEFGFTHSVRNDYTRESEADTHVLKLQRLQTA